MKTKPRLLITMGDVAGVGPEIIVRAWREIQAVCEPIAVGDAYWLQKTLEASGAEQRIVRIDRIEERPQNSDSIVCLQATQEDLRQVWLGEVSATAGKAAYDFLCTAIDLAMNNLADAIVTAPLHKRGLKKAGLSYPGHTEILAERTGSRQVGMMLYHEGLSVVHVTLHIALRKVFEHLTSSAVLEKIQLLSGVLPRLLGRPGRIGVAALNPHASDGGLFGSEEQTVIEPAIQAARAEGIAVSGPWPCDTLFLRARRGEFDGVVAMYHDQGHIAMKLLSGLRAVNISLGLPIVRTSVAHGTAYDIAGTGTADAQGLVEAARVAVRLSGRQPVRTTWARTGTGAEG